MKKIILLIAEKDIKLVIKNKVMFISLLIVPIIFTVILPSAMFILWGQFDEIKDMEKIQGILTDELKEFNPMQQYIYVGVNYYFPTLFLIIPLITSSIFTGNSFVSEREGKTIETLLYSPLTVKELFRAKVASSFILSFSMTLLSFILFSIVVMIGQSFYFDQMIFPNLKWFIFLFWVCPAVIILGLIFMVRISATSKTYQEAQQKVAFIVLPVILLIVGQSTGLFFLNTLWMLIIGGAFYILDLLIAGAATENFVPEKLVN